MATTTLLLLIDGEPYAIINVGPTGVFDVPVNPERGPLRNRIEPTVAFIEGFIRFREYEPAAVGAESPEGIAVAVLEVQQDQPWENSSIQA